MTRVLDRLAHPVLVDRIVVLAMFLAPVFSAAMAQHVEAGRILTGKGWRADRSGPSAISRTVRASNRHRLDVVRRPRFPERWDSSHSVVWHRSSRLLGICGWAAGRIRLLANGHGGHRRSADWGRDPADSGVPPTRRAISGGAAMARTWAGKSVRQQALWILNREPHFGEGSPKWRLLSSLPPAHLSAPARAHCHSTPAPRDSAWPAVGGTKSSWPRGAASLGHLTIPGGAVLSILRRVTGTPCFT
jgi:hypothetical protein